MEASILPQSLIQFRRHGILHFLVEVRVIEQLGEGIVVIKEALGHDVLELVREQRLHKHLRAVVLGILLKLLHVGILHKHLVDALDDHTVRVRKVAVEPLVHFVDDALQGVLLLVRHLWGHAAGGREDRRLFVQNDCPLERFGQGCIFQLDLVLHINDLIFSGRRQKAGKVQRVLILIEQVFIMEPHQLRDVGVRYTCKETDLE